MAVPEATSRRSSWGRVLIAVYAVFAVAATGRSVYQLATQASEAPFPYALSALAAVVYIAATLGLAREGEGWRKVAWVACATELVGVLVVGTLSVADEAAVPRRHRVVVVRRRLRLPPTGAAVRRSSVAVAHAGTWLTSCPCGGVGPSAKGVAA